MKACAIREVRQGIVDGLMDLSEDDDQPKKLSTGKKIRIAVAVALALLAGGSLLYTRYGITKQGLPRSMR